MLVFAVLHAILPLRFPVASAMAVARVLAQPMLHRLLVRVASTRGMLMLMAMVLAVCMVVMAMAVAVIIVVAVVVVVAMAVAVAILMAVAMAKVPVPKHRAHNQIEHNAHSRNDEHDWGGTEGWSMSK